jgi:hypothetical protein
MIISHRINTLEQVTGLFQGEAIEFDVRDSNGKCIVEHDAFQNGLDFEVFLKRIGKRFLIVNIKSEGIEKRVLELLDMYNLHEFFLLDCSFPKIVELSKQNERRIAIRFSEYESLETVLSLEGKIDWVWVDCFTKFILTREISERLHLAGFKICLVSPELQKRPEELEFYAKRCIAESIKLDGVCCKQHNRHHWEEYYTSIHF